MLSAVLVLPFALLRGHFFPLGTDLSLSDVLIVITGLCVGLCTVLYIRLDRHGGRGVRQPERLCDHGCGYCLERDASGRGAYAVDGLALLLIVLGLALVGPKREAGNIDVEFRRRGRA